MVDFKIFYKFEGDECTRFNLFNCGDGLCIPEAWVCDFRQQCPSGNDETNCSQNLNGRF